MIHIKPPRAINTDRKKLRGISRLINSGDLKIRIDKIKSDSRFPAIDLSKYPNNLELATRINKMVKHPKKFLKTSRLMLL